MTLLRIGFDHDENPYNAAQRFIDENEFNQNFLSEIAEFIQKQVSHGEVEMKFLVLFSTETKQLLVLIPCQQSPQSPPKEYPPDYNPDTLSNNSGAMSGICLFSFY